MRYFLLIPSILWLTTTSLSIAAEGEIGKVRNVSGEAYLIRADARELIELGVPIQQNDILETSADGTVGITFNDNTVLSTGPNSTVHMEQFQFNPSNLKGNFRANLKKGTLSIISGDIARGNSNAMVIKTPSAVLGVRGTRFLVRVLDDE
jgi:hypothetical protein